MMDRGDSTPKGFGDFFLAIPWPWHLGLAVAGYLILHALAAREIPLPDQTPDETALYAHRLVWKTAAWFFSVSPAGNLRPGGDLLFSADGEMAKEEWIRMVFAELA